MNNKRTIQKKTDCQASFLGSVKYFIVLFWLLANALSGLGQDVSDSFQRYPVYAGTDLGVSYSVNQTLFKVWAPTASKVLLRLFKSGDKDSAFATIPLTKDIQGTWQTIVNKDVSNIYYTFQVEQGNKWLEESPDIYSKAVGVNGKRGMVVNLAETNPVNWDHDRRMQQKNYTDIILYETHVRDFSISSTSGIKNKGKFLGFTEKGTKNPEGVSTGLDHLKELGITHVHLLPSFDYRSVDETRLELNRYNWGYDPLNYNAPEGSYTTNPYNGNVRIKEFKQMVQSLHGAGIGVILDVVYNHTGNTSAPFNQFAPGYFYRHNTNGTYSNGTGTGNETASERAMMRKFMIESVVYWAKEYHLDGFRFDLMGVHDIITMNRLAKALHQIDPHIFIYGEGWAAGASPYPEALRVVKDNIAQVDSVAVFNDDLRDGLRGPYDKKQKGFVSGSKTAADDVKFGITACTEPLQPQFQQAGDVKKPWAKEPYQTINYASCHDDPTLFDRLVQVNPDAAEADIIKMDRLAQTIVFTSQGVAFLHGGAELLRTKKGVENSYKSPDSINEIDWSRKVKYAEVYQYYKSLIALRKHHPAFRMPSSAMIQQHLEFIDTSDPLLISYQIKGHANADKWKNILVLFNGDTTIKKINLPLGKWVIAADGNSIKENGIKREIEKSIDVYPISAYVLFQL